MACTRTGYDILSCAHLKHGFPHVTTKVSDDDTIYILEDGRRGRFEVTERRC